MKRKNNNCSHGTFYFLDSHALCNPQKHSIWLNIHAASIVGVLPSYVYCTRLHDSNTSTRSLALDKQPNLFLGEPRVWARFCDHESQAANPFVHAAACALHTWVAPLLMQHQVGHRSVRLFKIGNPVAADCAILLPASLVVPWP